MGFCRKSKVCFTLLITIDTLHPNIHSFILKYLPPLQIPMNGRNIELSDSLNWS